MVHPTASIIILSSSDARNWRQVHRFRVEKRDIADARVGPIAKQLLGEYRTLVRKECDSR